MGKRHRITAGEGISSLADRYGFFPETLWDHPENEELKALRRHPNQLVEGDEVFIPDGSEKTVEVASGRLHVFRRRGVPAMCSVKLLQRGKPRAGAAFSVEVDGVPGNGVTDDAGVASFHVPLSAQRALLRLEETGEQYTLLLAGLHPIETDRGVLQRLKNLGYYAGPVDEPRPEEARAALDAFQREAGLEVTGEADHSTRERLRQLHDSPEALRRPEGSAP